MVEGKVSESFGPSLGAWMVDFTPGKKTRLAFLRSKLGLDQELPTSLRYQLLHRLASAVIEAERFGARYAVMMIHSFSPADAWFDDYVSFLSLFNVRGETGTLVRLAELNGVSVFAGWVRGDPKYLQA